jgi:glycine/D-amino acid oxidase-like deaminating enzyme
MHSEHARVVICGAGVIGSAIAYYLGLRGVSATLVERVGVASAASGKAGGFLALDWCDQSALGPLARKSFQLHAELAATFGDTYGYRRMTTLAARSQPQRLHHVSNLPEELAWFNRYTVPYSVLGTPQTTAQVHPALFTQTLLQQACHRGAQLIIGCVEGVDVANGSVQGVRVDGDIVPADAVVIAMGPWSTRAAQGLPLPPVHGLKGHSITVKPTTPIPAHAVFMDYTTDAGERLEPEIFPRPDGEVYLCGLSDTTPLPERADQVVPRSGAGAILQQVAGHVSSSLLDVEPQVVQACYRPVYDDGLPLLGPVPGVAGAYVATGHSCWGILNAPASGLAMAELIVEGQAQSVDLRAFDPQRAWVTS